MKKNIDVDNEKNKKSYEKLDRLQRKESQLKASYAQKGLKKPDIIA